MSESFKLQTITQVLRGVLRAATIAQNLIGARSDLAIELNEMVITPLDSLIYGIEHGDFDENGKKRNPEWSSPVKDADGQRIGEVSVRCHDGKYTGYFDSESITKPLDTRDEAVACISEWAGGQGWSCGEDLDLLGGKS